VTEAQQLIDRLGLIPHPEGGWYGETWRAAAPDGARAGGTLIHFMLTSGQRSHWHRVDADEIWLWQAGDPIELTIAPDVATPITLGLDRWQAVVPAGHWQAATPVPGPHGYALVSCVVVPGFEFAGFELAPPGWAPGL